MGELNLNIGIKLYIKKHKLAIVNKSKFTLICKVRWQSILNSSLCDAEKIYVPN